VAFIWHDPQDKPPTYHIPKLEEHGEKGWTDWHIERLAIATNQREIIENVADSAHFVPVHSMIKMDEFENIYEGHTATQIMKGKVPGGSIHSKATYYGPAFQYTWLSSAVQSCLINANTPIDENHVHLWFGIMIKSSNLSADDIAKLHHALSELGFEQDFEPSVENMQLMQQALVDATRKGYYDDVAIWEHKLYRPQPILCDGDGPLNKLRQWYQQFYQDT